MPADEAAALLSPGSALAHDAPTASFDSESSSRSRTGALVWLSRRQELWALLLFALLARVVSLGLYPLTDTTEARYGEIARKMLETGQWLMPQIDYGVPFWGKPPLSFWLTAASFRAFGVTAFAARLPSLLLGMGICALAYLLARRRHGVDHGLRAALVVATSLLMMLSAGSVMTDPAMVLGTSLCMVAFWLAVSTASRFWGYLFFAGLAIGLMAKGPVAAILSLAPVTIWAVLAGRVRETWRSLPWIKGAALTAALVVPWYWAAELKSPGFLHYFLVGEHWQRFTVSGWKGDLYGSGHAYPRGTIWLFALLGTLPWSPWLMWQLMHRPQLVTIPALRADGGWLLYLWCWMLAPVVFFTLSRNILPTYVLTGLVGFGLLVAETWERRRRHKPLAPQMNLALATPAAVVMAMLFVGAFPSFHSQDEIVSRYQSSAREGSQLIYVSKRPYSASFYSRGRALEVRDYSRLRQLLAQPADTYVAAENSAFQEIPVDIRSTLSLVTTSSSGEYLLLRHAASSDTH